MNPHTLSVEPMDGLAASPMPAAIFAPHAAAPSSPMIEPQAGCRTCRQSGGEPEMASEAARYVYALGRIEARFPSLAVEKEFAQATRRTDSAGKTDRQTFHAVLAQRENRYLARQMCWVLSTQGFDAYLLLARETAELDLLIEAIRPNPAAGDIDVVIGELAAVTASSAGNGLRVPAVTFDQIYSFDRRALLEAIPKPQQAAAQFSTIAEELFDRILQLTDNAGASDGHRALNYLAMRYPAIYVKTAEQFALDCSLASVEVEVARFSSTRKILDVRFAYTNRKTDFTEKYSVRVDVTEEFPFLVTKLAPCLAR